ncbi:MAG: DUF3394 domain-containing protein, partial [Acidiferrobacterales bacterium]|nr:DUF3394 domain-containing protein [Acidiferrobacterales bacterium]
VSGEEVSKTVSLPMGPAADGETRLKHGGILIRIEEGKVLIDNVEFASEAEKNGLEWDWEITGLEVRSERPPEELMFIPALALLGLLAWLQLRRRSPVDMVAES